ncbi:MAG: VOC family protein [Pseudomonadota bacterium]|nr:VOC family protein [Pseudomonadota bacterium]
MAELDHLVLGCLSLAEWRPRLEELFGVAAQGGGAHEGLGTHNALWGLARQGGGRCYLELIAPDPAQDWPAEEPTPFGLGLAAVRAGLEQGPRLLTWVARDADAAALLARGPAAMGPLRPMRRGALEWRLASPADGVPLMGGALPFVIEWPEGPTPSDTLAGSGLTLTGFARRPDPEAGAALAAMGLAALAPEGETGGGTLRAEIEGPGGTVALN